MEKLSILLFSRNKVETVIRLIKEVYPVGDEIVLIDSSDREERRKIDKAKKFNRWHKLHIFYIIPTGLVETARPYGLMKCRHNWVLYLDADESPSKALKNDIRSIISNTRFSAFNIKRFEKTEEDGSINASFFTWNIRLYRKNEVRYKGIIHEQPEVHGELGTLDNRYFIRNMSEYKNPLTGQEYHRLMKLERLSYKTYNEALLRNMNALYGKETAPEKIAIAILKFYEWITFRQSKEELSNFDYFIYNLTKHFILRLKGRDWKGIATLIPEIDRHVKMIESWKREPDSEDIFAISQRIFEVGIVKMVGFDDEKTINRLNRKYKDSTLGGSGLLLLLLKENMKNK